MNIAASGMGLAVVEDLVSKGWKIAIFDFDEAAGKKVAEKLGEKILFIKGNVAKYEEIGAAFVEVWKKWGQIDFGESDRGGLLPILSAIKGRRGS
jgi:NAD(P)-dependent dehydrogenase (short-subunit alcohol dehydrogenase family)